MSDAARDVPKKRGLAFCCQRCGGIELQLCDDPEVAVRRAVEANEMHTFHKCRHDGGLGICRLVGEATSYPNAAEAMKAGREATQ